MLAPYCAACFFLLPIAIIPRRELSVALRGIGFRAKRSPSSLLFFDRSESLSVRTTCALLMSVHAERTRCLSREELLRCS